VVIPGKRKKLYFSSSLQYVATILSAHTIANMTMTITDFSSTFKDEIGVPKNTVFLTSLKRN